MAFIEVPDSDLMGQPPQAQPVQISPTAVQGQMDKKDFLVYGSILCIYGGTGEQQFFAVNKGQRVPLLGTPSTAASNAPPPWYVQGSDQTTVLQDPSKLGSLGDGNVRSIALSAKQAKQAPTGGGLASINNYGATPFEIEDINDKCTFFFKIGTKEELQGPAGMFPTNEGAVGGISTTANNTTSSVVTSGIPHQGRGLRYQPRIVRTDNFEARIKTAPGASFVFIRTVDDTAQSGNTGQPVLLTCTLLFTMDADRR